MSDVRNDPQAGVLYLVMIVGGVLGLIIMMNASNPIYLTIGAIVAAISILGPSALYRKRSKDRDGHRHTRP